MECCSNYNKNEKYKKTKRSDEDKNKLVTRINKLIGQMNGIKKMIEDDRYCDDILIQLSAIDKSIKSLANVILDNHMHTFLSRFSLLPNMADVFGCDTAFEKTVTHFKS